MARDVVFADGPQGEARAGAHKPIADSARQQHGEINEEILAEDEPADERQIRKAGDVEVRRRCALQADETAADEVGEATPEDRQRKARGDLICGEADRQKREDRRHQHAAEDAREDADHRRIRHIGEGEAGRRADDHHALEAEVEHTGALGDDLADRSQQKRGRRRHDDHQDVLDLLRIEAHVRPPKVKRSR